MPMTTTDLKAVLSVIKTLEYEISNAVTRAEELKDPLAPTPFAPASEEFANAADNLKDLPFTQEEVDQAIANVKETIERREYAAEIGDVAKNVIGKLKDLLPLLFSI